MNIKIPLVDLKIQYDSIRSEIDSAIRRVLETTNFILGEEVESFEENFASYVRAKGAVGVSSGTAALHLALLACNIGKGDEVLVPANTFFATAEAVSMTGARPVFVDINPGTYLIDPDCVPSAITSKTRAVIAVHLFGQPADMDELMQICDRHGLLLIEDAAQAHGAVYKGRRCGSIGNLACFSFYPGKNLGAYGDGGIVTGNDTDLLEKVRVLRNHGSSQKYLHKTIGWCYRLDAIQAAILNAKLPYLEQWTAARQARAEIYDKLLSELDLLRPVRCRDRRHVFHLYVVRLLNRDKLVDHLKSRGISSGIHYPIPLHRQPAYEEIAVGQSYPNSEAAAAQILSLPMFPELSSNQQCYVVDAISDFMSNSHCS